MISHRRLNENWVLWLWPVVHLLRCISGRSIDLDSVLLTFGVEYMSGATTTMIHSQSPWQWIFVRSKNIISYDVIVFIRSVVDANTNAVMQRICKRDGSSAILVVSCARDFHCTQKMCGMSILCQLWYAIYFVGICSECGLHLYSFRVWRYRSYSSTQHLSRIS